MSEGKVMIFFFQRVIELLEYPLTSIAFVRMYFSLDRLSTNLILRGIYLSSDAKSRSSESIVTQTQSSATLTAAKDKNKESVTVKKDRKISF